MDIAWQKGQVHWGDVNNASIAYTLEYITTKQTIQKKHNRDDRTPEFSLYSKGLGENYLSEQVKKFHKKNLYNMYITIEDNTKIPMPKYYRNKIFSDQEKENQAEYISYITENQRNEEMAKKSAYQIDSEKLARQQRLFKQKTNKKI